MADDDKSNSEEELEVGKGEDEVPELDDEEVQKTKPADSDSDDDEVQKRKVENSESDDDEEVEKRKIEESDDDDGDEKVPKRIIVESDSEDDDDVKERKVEESDEEEDDDDGAQKRKAEDVDDDDEEVQEKKGEDEDDDEEEEEEEEEEERKPVNDTVYDFDIMMAKKKEENSRKRKRRNYEIINDNDDIIADIINQMRDAVESDIEANKNKVAATKKLKLLPFVMNQLRKVDLRDAFLDSDVLSVITDWLTPLPDKSLPHLNIRENLLKILIDFNLYDVDRIKGSGIGKAIMYLYKHPKESRENKQRAKQLISCWSRPIFQLDSSFTSISREEREQRDLELRSKQRRESGHDRSDNEGPGSSSKKSKEETVTAQKPGDKGWIPRARVPAPSMRDYVIRPMSRVDGDIGKSSKRQSNMIDKYMKNQQERRRASKQQRAVNMKIDRV